MKGKTGSQGSLRHKGPYVGNKTLAADYYASRSQEAREPKKDIRVVFKERSRIRSRWGVADVAHLRWLKESGVSCRKIAEHYQASLCSIENLVQARLTFVEVEAEKDPNGWSPFDVKP